MRAADIATDLLHCQRQLQRLHAFARMPNRMGIVSSRIEAEQLRHALAMQSLERERIGALLSVIPAANDGASAPEAA